MYYLIDPTIAATAIGARCGDSVDPADEGLLNILSLLGPRVEDAMNVASLLYGQTTDTFSISRQTVNSRVASASPVELRLSNGYLDRNAEIVVTGPNGVVSAADYTVEARLGVVTLNKYDKGDYTVSYYAGFKPSINTENVENFVPVMENVPDWIKGVVVVLLTLWFRSMVLSPKVPEGFRFDAVLAPLFRDLSVRVTNRYNRPRALVEFPVDSVRTDGMWT